MTAITAKSFRVCRIDHSQEERILPASRWQVFCARVESVKPEMDTPTSGQPAADLRDYLAEERTFLAWIRTGIALMAFGIVLAHFGISADEAQATRYASEVEPHELSLWFGTALITIGVIAKREPGKLTWRVTPQGSLAVAQIRPSCASMIERQIESPIPMPVGFVE